jgi:hypothetical protein
VLYGALKPAFAASTAALPAHRVKDRSVLFRPLAKKNARVPNQQSQVVRLRLITCVHMWFHQTMFKHDRTALSCLQDHQQLPATHYTPAVLTSSSRRLKALNTGCFTIHQMKQLYAELPFLNQHAWHNELTNQAELLTSKFMFVLCSGRADLV